MQELTFMAPVQAWLAAAWGAFHGAEQNLRGQQDLHFGCKKNRVTTNGSNMPFNANSIIYGSKAVWDLSQWEGQEIVFTQGMASKTNFNAATFIVCDLSTNASSVSAEIIKWKLIGLINYFNQSKNTKYKHFQLLMWGFAAFVCLISL